MALPEGARTTVADRCAACPIRNWAVCGALADDQLAELNRIAAIRKVPAGRVVMAEEMPAEVVCNVRSGVIKLIKSLADGRQQIVGLLFASDFLGRPGRRTATYTAEAVTEVELCCFPIDGFERFLASHPSLEHRLFEYTLDELDAARDWMLLLGRKTAEEKVASFLLMLARRGGLRAAPGDGPGLRVTVPLSRANIADYVGLTLETVSRHMSQLRARGLIALPDPRVVTILDRHRLETVAGECAGVQT